VTFARIQLPVLALRASTHSPGINDLFLIVLGTTTITLPNPDGLNTNRALDLLPGGNTRTLNGSLRPLPWHSPCSSIPQGPIQVWARSHRVLL
jgi:hypothetical protein